MPGFLRQSTASQTKTIGPFLDRTDTVTSENGLTIANTDIKLKKEGGASASKNSGGATADGTNGMYHCTFDATDTATVGQLFITVDVAGALPYRDVFTVIEEAVYDALFAASAPGYLQPTTAGRTLDVTATGAAGIDWGNVENPTTAVNLSATNIDTDQVVASVTGAVGSVTGNVGGNVVGSVASVSGAVGSVTGNVGGSVASVVGAVGSVTGNVGGNVTGSVGSVATGGITAGSIAADAIGASELAADAVAEIADAVWDEVLSGHLTAGSTGNALNAAGSAGDPWSTALPGAYGAGTAGKIVGDNINATISSRASQTSLDTVDDFLDTEVAAIKAKTDNLPTDPADASDIASSFSTVNSTLATIATYIDTEVAAIKAKTDNLPADPADQSAVEAAITAAQVVLVAEHDATQSAIAALNNLSSGGAQTAANAALVALGLDHLVSASVAGTDITDNSIIAKLASKSATADWDDYVNTTDSLQAIRDRGDAAWTTGGGAGASPNLLQETTIATLTSQTVFTLTDGSADNDAYNGQVVVVEDQSTAEQKSVGIVSDYVGATKTVTLSTASVFTVAVGDTIRILASSSLPGVGTVSSSSIGNGAASTPISRVFTFQDAIDSLMDTEGVSGGQSTRMARAAVMEAYRELPTLHDWAHFRRRGTIKTVAVQSTGTVVYTHSSRTVTLTGATFPATDTHNYRIKFSGTSYPIESYGSTTTVILPSTFNPGANVASTTYELFRPEYPVPNDFRQGGALLHLTNDSYTPIWVPHVSLMQWLALSDSTWDGNNRYTIRSDSQGRMVFDFAPAPRTEIRYEFAYRAEPRALQLFGGSPEYTTGTLSTSGTSVTGSGTVWLDAMEGCVIRFIDSVTAPTGINGRPPATDNPYTEQRWISAVNSTTAIVISESLVNTYTGKAYSIGAPIDIESTAMQNLFHRLVELKFAIKTRQADKKIELRQAAYMDALRKAQEADYRLGDIETGARDSYSYVGSVDVRPDL